MWALRTYRGLSQCSTPQERPSDFFHGNISVPKSSKELRYCVVFCNVELLG